MNEFLSEAHSLVDGYHKALKILHKYGIETDCPDYNTKQKEISMTISVLKATSEPMISKLFIGGPRELEQYRQEILYGILDFEVERGNWDYTYHSRMAEQFDFLKWELERNPSSRRAVIDIRDWQIDSTKDSPACLQHIQYFIRQGKLHCKVLFRSNDAVKATFMNAFALIQLQNKIAKEIKVNTGSYVHRANSFHVYERDYDLLERYVQAIKTKRRNELSYRYKGEWDELMKLEKPDIKKMAKELKERPLSHGGMQND